MMGDAQQGYELHSPRARSRTRRLTHRLVTCLDVLFGDDRGRVMTGRTSVRPPGSG